MSDEQIVTLTDADKPNAGRVYDYLLGGHHNFEIDRKAGDELLKIVPFASKLAKLGRWFLGKGVEKSLEIGFTQFIDFASGLPTVNHIHLNTPPGTKIVYSDIDPVTVQNGKKIVKDNPLVKYESCDIRTPENLLESEIVTSMFKDNRKVAIGFNGICWFLTDEEIKYSMKVVYDWVDKGSILFFNDLDYNAETITSELQAFINLYKSMNQPFIFRTQDKMNELIKPWEVMGPGFLNLEKWQDKPSLYTNATIKFLGGGSGFYGGFLIK